MNKKYIIITIILLIIYPTIEIQPVSAVSWGISVGGIYTYQMDFVLDGSGNNKTSAYYYTQTMAAHTARTGQIWEWEVMYMTPEEIGGEFRCSDGFVEDWKAFDHFDNIDPTILPVTPFFFIQDWVAQGADFAGMHGPGMNPDSYAYGTMAYYYELQMTYGYLLYIYYNDVMFGGDSIIQVSLVDITPPGMNPNYPYDTSTIPDNQQTGTTTPDGNGGGGGDGEDLLDGIETVLEFLQEESFIPGIPWWIILLLLIILFILFWLWKKEQEKKGKRGTKSYNKRRHKKKKTFG